MHELVRIFKDKMMSLQQYCLLQFKSIGSVLTCLLKSLKTYLLNIVTSMLQAIKSWFLGISYSMSRRKLNLTNKWKDFSIFRTRVHYDGRTTNFSISRRKLHLSACLPTAHYHVSALKYFCQARGFNAPFQSYWAWKSTARSPFNLIWTHFPTPK